MKFSEKLRIETKSTHLAVDRHPFVNLIKTNPKAGYLYMQFNKISVLELQKNALSKTTVPFSKFNYKISDKDIEIALINIPHFKSFLERCNNYYLEHFYMIQLGLLFGGNMLKKILPENEKDFFDIEGLSDKGRLELIKEFKEYLDNNIIDIEDQIDFIKIVNESYLIIKDIFDEYHKLL
jgi:heme oxygenase